MLQNLFPRATIIKRKYKMAVNDLGNLFLYGTFVSACNSIYVDAPKFLNIPMELTIVL